MAKEIGGQTHEEDERQELSPEVKKLIQAEGDRVRTDYSRRLKDVEAERDELKQSILRGKAQDSEEARQLLADLAEFRAQKALVQRQAETLQKAAERRIPLDAALELAALDNAPDLVERLNGIIEQRVKELYNQELLDAAHKPGLGDGAGLQPSYFDIMKMSAEQQRRLPSAVFTRALDRAMKGEK